MLEQNPFSTKIVSHLELSKQGISLLLASDGSLISCSKAAGQLLKQISNIAFVDSQETVALQAISQNSEPWEQILFKDQAELRKILRQIKKKQHALNVNVELQIAPNKYESALVVASPLVPSNHHELSQNLTSQNFTSNGSATPDSAEILIIIKFNSNKKEIAALLEYKKNSLWDKIWSIAFNNSLTQATTQELLRLVGEFFKAKRIYILSSKTKHLPLSINYGWCAENVATIIDTIIVDSNAELLAPFDFITQHCEPYYAKNTSFLSRDLQKACKKLDLEAFFVLPCSRKAKQELYHCAQPELYFVLEPFASAPAWTQEEQAFICELGSFIASAVLHHDNLLAEQGLENALRTVFSAFEASIFLIREETGFVQFANRMCQMMFGSKLVGFSCLDGANKDLELMFLNYHRLQEKRILQEHNGSKTLSDDLACDKKIQFECFLPERQRWFYVETSPLNNEQYSDSVLFSALDISYRKEEEVRLKNMSITDAQSGALYLPFGLELFEAQVAELNKGRNPISVVCISFDNYQDLNISNKPNNDNHMMSYVVRIIKLWRTDCQITRLSLNELLITLERVPLIEARAFFEHLPLILQENTATYSPYELTFSVGYAESNYMLRKNSASLLMEARSMRYEAQNFKRNYVYELLL